MTGLKVKDKDIVIPGEELAEGMGYLPGNKTYRDGDKVIASCIGLVNVEGRAVKLIPLSGRYNPKRGDTIIVNVIDITLNGWILETNSAYSAMLNLKDASSEYIARGANLTRYFDIGDYLVCKITNVTSQRLVDVTTKGPGLRKLKGGRIMWVNTNKVPRIIGREGSMVSMIKNQTGCRIIVGQNGIIWIDGTPEQEIVAVETIKKIEKESHLAGLTDRIKGFLDKNTTIKDDVKKTEKK